MQGAKRAKRPVFFISWAESLPGRVLEGGKEAQTKMTELMKRLVGAGYPREEMDHHYTDLYVYVNEISRPVIEQWCAEHGWRVDWMCPVFRDQITGRTMYDCAFQYAEGD